MLRIMVGPDDLAVSRFAVSPLGELEHLTRKLPASSAAKRSGQESCYVTWVGLEVEATVYPHQFEPGGGNVSPRSATTPASAP